MATMYDYVDYKLSTARSDRARSSVSEQQKSMPVPGEQVFLNRLDGEQIFAHVVRIAVDTKDRPRIEWAGICRGQIMSGSILVELLVRHKSTKSDRVYWKFNAKGGTHG